MRKTALLFLLPLCALSGKGQENVQPNTLRDFSYIERSNAWLNLSNAAGLTTFDKDNLSEASLHLAVRTGGLVDYTSSDKSLEYGADIKSFYRLNPKTVLYGKMEYSHHTERAVAGSAFMNTYHLPFNIIEATNENIGKKAADTYKLTGGVSYQIWRQLVVGGKVEFTAGNKAKYKDLRVKNKLMDLRSTIGVLSPISHWLTIGADYQYRRSTESLIFSTYGKTDRAFNSLIDYGGFYGKQEQYGGTGLTDASRENPLLSEYHGGGLQTELKLGRVSLFQSLEYAHRHGYFGKKSPYTLVHMRHNGDIFTYKGVFQLYQKDNLHQVTISSNLEKLHNFRTNYTSTQNSSGALYYIYHGSNKTADKLWLDGSFVYNGYYNIEQDLPRWELTLGFNWGLQKHTSYLYPLFRKQHYHMQAAFAEGKRNFCLEKGRVLSVQVGAAYAFGNGKIYQDGSYTEAEPTVMANTMELYAQQHYAYLMSPQWAVSSEIKYAIPFVKAHLNSYLALNAAYKRANGQASGLENKHRTELNLAIGCQF